MTPAGLANIGLLDVSEAFSSRVMKLTPHTSTIMDVFNNAHCPSGSEVESSSTFPLLELNSIKYLRLELALTLGHCLRWGGRRNSRLNLGHPEMLVFLIGSYVETRWINGKLDDAPRTGELDLAMKPTAQPAKTSWRRRTDPCDSIDSRLALGPRGSDNVTDNYVYSW